MPLAMTLVCIAMAFLNSCTGHGIEEHRRGTEKIVFVLKDIDNYTRSSLSTDDAAVEDISIFAYYEGFLLASGHWKAGEEMSLELDAGEVYDFYALANMGDVSLPVLEEDVGDYVYEIRRLSDMNDAFPMCWSRKGYVPDMSSPVDVSLTRLVSKVMLDVDCGDTGLRIRSVVLAQSPLSVSPFAPDGSKAVAGKVSHGDHAGLSDLAELNSGGSACFYMLENMQGTLLPGNSDPMNKVPQRVKGKAGVCTYVEIECEFMKDSGREGTARYRMYLGQDETTNFDVMRNSTLRLSLALTSDGLKIRDSWKITPDYIQHPTGVSLDTGTLNLLVGQKQTLSATVLPSDAAVKTVAWHSSDTRIALVSVTGVVTAKSEGVCTIRCVSAGRPEFYAECEVTVRDAVASLSFDRDRAEAVLGYEGESRTTDFAVYATYLSGKKVAVTDACNYTSSSASATVRVPGVLTHLSPGEAVITARYEGHDAVMTSLTEAFAVSSVEFEQSEYAVSLGESQNIRYRVLYNDGTSSNYISYILVNQKCWGGIGYSVGNSSVAYVNDYGKITPYGAGRTDISVSVMDRNTQKIYEASVTLTVNEAYLVSVYAEGPAMFYDGSGGPVLYGVYSDGSERNLTASASWKVGNSGVTYSPGTGIMVSDTHDMKEGVTLVTFTGTFQGKSASVAMKYGKWVREVVFRKTSAGAGSYNYRLALVFDDFTETFVPFTYQTSTDGTSWSASVSAPASGVTIAATVPVTMVRGRTAGYYYDYRGDSMIWSAGKWE